VGYDASFNSFLYDDETIRRMNRLAESHSPYLLQHKDNPVNWQPWDDLALKSAIESGLPIFLSIGYAACHWCHVMEHESFEDVSIATMLNENFVCIKVDREERPDVDMVYMNAVQLMTGRGGWPMSVFLTPDRKPFFAGTYWPNPARGGMPGFAQVLDALIHAWKERRNDVLEHASDITRSLCQLASGPLASANDQLPSTKTIDDACLRLIRIADTKLGGFGAAPKFPHATDLDLLLRRHHSDRDAKKLQVVTCSLDAMAAGGIFDHVGGGFARYSVDAQWLVPHFEKMLYDNALLARLYVDAFQVTGVPRYEQVARQTLDYLLREMQDEAGGIHSSEDADSEGVEGKFYVWKPEQVKAVIGNERAERWCAIYDITPQGNFEGNSIPRLKMPIIEFARSHSIDPEVLQKELADDREALRSVRDTRVHPGRDDKVLMGWNALACEAFATAGAVLDERKYVEASEQIADFIWSKMRRADGRFYHAYRRGHAHIPAFQDDLANFIFACVAVFRASGRARWIDRASKVATQMLDHYEDREAGGFFYTADDAETVITRHKEWHDGSVRSGNGAAALALLELAELTGNTRFAEAASRTLIAAREVIEKQSAASAHLLVAFNRHLHRNEQIVIAASDWENASPLRRLYHQAYRPHTTLSWVIGEAPETGPVQWLNANKHPLGDEPTLYVCRDYRCEQPLTGIAAREALRR
jgi:uncharacterized protein